MAKKKNKKKKKSAVKAKNTQSKFAQILQAVWEIIINKKDTEKLFTNTALALVISLFFNLIALLLGLIAVYGVVDGICTVVHAVAKSVDVVLYGIVQVLIFIIMAFFALVLRGMANEAGREKDSNYLVSLFTGITGFVALIVALIALLRGDS